jgi:LysR family transcriptional regulator, hydrogen peroxide-inducible genes activator
MRLAQQADGFSPPFSAQPIYAERFVVARSLPHRFTQRNTVEMAEFDGETYPDRINSEFRDHLAEKLTECGAAIARSCRSERKDWVQTMVAAGMGICFLPEFTASVPGLVTRTVQPEVTREVCLGTVAGRRWSAPVTAFVKAVRAYPWSHEPAVASPPILSA